MKLINLSIFVTLLTATLPSYAKGPSENLSAASKHSALATAHSVKGTVQVASVAAAVPLIAVGSAGVASVAAGEKMLEVASAKPRKAQKPAPLDITEITITVDRSPAQAMKKDQ